MADQAGDRTEVLRQGRAHALGDARLDAGLQLTGVQDAAHVLGHREFHDPDRAQFDVHVHHRADRTEGEAHEGVALAVRVQGFRGVGAALGRRPEFLAGHRLRHRHRERAVVRRDATVLDLQELRRHAQLVGHRLEELGADHLGRPLHRAARHPRVAAVRRRAGRRLVGVHRGHGDLVDAQDLLDDLPGQRGEALAGVDGRADDRGRAAHHLHRGRGDLVGPLGAEHVDHADAVAHPAPYRARLARALRAARQQPLVLRGVLGQGGQFEVADRAQQFRHRGRAGHRLAGGEQVSRRQDVAHAQLGPVDAEGGRELVHLALVRGAHLHGALAADVARRRVVGAYRPALDEGVRDDVGAAGEGHRRRQGLGGGIGVGAAVHEDLCLDLDEAPLRVRVVAVAQQGRVPVGVAEEGLLAGGGQFDRAARAQGEQAERELEGGVLAVGRGARHAGDDHAHAVRIQSEAGGGQVAVGVRVGGRGVELHAAVGARHGQSGLGADGGGVLAADPVQALDHDVAGGFRVAVAERDVPDQVAVGVQGGGAEGLLGVGDRVEELVLDRDRGGGEPCGVGVVGGDGGDGLAVVAYDVVREHRPVGDPAAVRGGAGHVGVGDDGADAGHLGGGRGVDGEDPGVGVRGAQHGGPQEALGPQVGGVGEGALGLGAGVRGRDGGSDSVRDLLFGSLGTRGGHGRHRGVERCRRRRRVLPAHAVPPWWMPPSPGAA